MLSQKDGLLKYVKFEFRHVCNFSYFEKKMVKFSVKIPWRFDTILLIRSILLFFIIYDTYD